MGSQSEQHFSGTISDVDTATNSLTLRTSDGQEKKFKANASSKVNLGSMGTKFSDLKEGQHVTITAKGDAIVSISQSSASGSSTGSGSYGSGSSTGSGPSTGSGSDNR
jgi:hypothetical protein